MNMPTWQHIAELLHPDFIDSKIAEKKGDLAFITPVTGQKLGYILATKVKDINNIVNDAHIAFTNWQLVPAPKRGELIRLYANKLRHHKAQLAYLVTAESGKIYPEALGEVQEMIDICDFAVGLSRQLYGHTMGSERSHHRLQEMWHPLGVVAIITAFNFPVAVFAWNAALALVCGNSIIWKPSEKTPTSALYAHQLLQEVLADSYPELSSLAQIVLGDKTIAESLVNNPAVKLVSATGSTQMGKSLAPKVATRLGRTLLELGGNNAMLVTKSANLNLALQAVVFSAVGTCGQRCTTLRRLFLHEDIAFTFTEMLTKAYNKLAIGNPFSETNLIGPLIDKNAYDKMQAALKIARKDGAKVFGGEKITPADINTSNILEKDVFYVTPAIVFIDKQTDIVKQETFAPILYVIEYTNLHDAIKWHNAVNHGLSSAIFTQDTTEAETFMGPGGSDCGIVNLNVGTTGAEIGGAFGGEKDTGGGRESGSDAWKNYMRRTTNTINYSTSLPLAQNINFDLS